MNDIVDRVARILAPRLEGGRKFDQMAADSRALKIRVSDGTGWPNDATQEHAIEAARAVIAAIQGPDVAALAELRDMLESADEYEGKTIFNHTPDEIGLHIMDNHEAIIAALAPFTKGPDQ